MRLTTITTACGVFCGATILPSVLALGSLLTCSDFDRTDPDCMPRVFSRAYSLNTIESVEFCLAHIALMGAGAAAGYGAGRALSLVGRVCVAAGSALDNFSNRMVEAIREGL